ncbi:JNK-interacting protein 1-like [Diaphorina citri]|uniref:JNK-interacting protein 1-like n=1 Tax=Diaphorina citri TaxID=121845 RepID=A0A1S3D4I4_DIACI|nr:JNK-interacting protein 1-like [Diaphorina citri]
MALPAFTQPRKDNKGNLVRVIPAFPERNGKVAASSENLNTMYLYRNVVCVMQLAVNRLVSAHSVPSLADELGDLSPWSQETDSTIDSDTERYYPSIDSGLSLVSHHNLHDSTISSRSASPVTLPPSKLELLEATHRSLHKFIPRHFDEVELEIGDPIYVSNEAEDLWCEGVNLRTGRQGIFPSAYAVDVEYEDLQTTTPKPKRERFLLGYLGSVETSAHKGNAVICQAVHKIRQTQHRPHSCILEVSDEGLRMVEKSRPGQHRKVRGLDYFYSLKNVMFCGFHPREPCYLGFISKHPNMQRFACHVFLASESTRPVAEAVGRAFQRFYEKFIETAFPIEDIYIEEDF